MQIELMAINLSAGSWKARDRRHQIIVLMAMLIGQLQGIIIMSAIIIQIRIGVVGIVDAAASAGRTKRLDHQPITMHENMAEALANNRPIRSTTEYPVLLHDVDRHNTPRPQQRQLHDHHALLLERFRSLSDQAVQSIQSSDGDVIDCVPLEKQLAFQHPLLKGHKIQRFPSSFPWKARQARRRKRSKKKRRWWGKRVWLTTEEEAAETRSRGVVAQVWHERSDGQREYCPAGSIPVRRTSEWDIERWAAELLRLETSKKNSHATTTTSTSGHGRRPSSNKDGVYNKYYYDFYGTKTHMPPRPPHPIPPQPPPDSYSNSSIYHSSSSSSSSHVRHYYSSSSSSNSSNSHMPSSMNDYAHAAPPTPPPFGGGAGGDALSSSAPHEHAIAYYVADNADGIYGASAVVSVWDPWVEAPDEFSLSQIWVLAGSFDGHDLNSIEAGWQVSPELYGDGNPRLFTYWTTDGYATTGCYNLLCSGFVQVSDSVAIGASIAPISSFGGSQFQIEIMIWKDPREGNWWMAFEGTHVVGYWPAELFSHLSNRATMVEFGGEVVNSSPYGRHTATQMGSGRFPGEGFGYAGFFHSLQVVDSSNNLRGISNLETLVEDGGCYDVRSIHQDPDWGTAFYFGGPGHNALCP